MFKKKEEKPKEQKAKKLDINKIIEKCDKMMSEVDENTDLQKLINDKFTKEELQFLTYQYITTMKSISNKLTAAQDEAEKIPPQMQPKEMAKDDVMYM